MSLSISYARQPVAAPAAVDGVNALTSDFRSQSESVQSNAKCVQSQEPNCIINCVIGDHFELNSHNRNNVNYYLTPLIERCESHNSDWVIIVDSAKQMLFPSLQRDVEEPPTRGISL